MSGFPIEEVPLHLVDEPFLQALANELRRQNEIIVNQGLVPNLELLKRLEGYLQ